MLHGCTQNPTDFADGTMMNQYGEKYQAYVLYPLQPSSANTNKCWNWFEKANQNRGSGEPKLIADMTKAVMAKYPSISPDRVFIGGLSAGAAMSVLVGIDYPDVFRCVAVGAGLEYKAATSVTEAYLAMSNGGPDPVTQGRSAYTAEGSNAALQCVLVIHGTSDTTVNIKNADQVVTQYATTLSLIFGRGQTTNQMTNVPTTSQDGTAPVTNGRRYTLYNYDYTATGRTMMKYVKVTSMGHAWSGGSSKGSYTDPTGPDASLIMVDFFYSFVENNSTTSSTSTDGTDTTSTSTTDGTDTTSSTTGTDGSTDGSTTSSTTGTDTTSTTTGGLDNEMIFYSVGYESGWVGQLVSDGMSNNQLLVGDKGMFNINTYKSIISFDTSALPSGISITSAKLLLKRRSLSGTVNSVNIDIKDGGFGDSNNLERSDFNAVASAYNITTLVIPSSDGQTSTTYLPSSSFRYITNGVDHRTQFRLSSLTTATFAANQLIMYGGVDESQANSAALVINW